MVLLKITFNIDPEMYKDIKKAHPDMVSSVFLKEQAEEISKLPGLIWKLWTTHTDKNKGAGFYLYATKNDAEHRAAWAEKNFGKMPGLTNVETEIFDIMEDLTRMTSGPIDMPANPSLKK